jgi:hypothetical protein
MGEGREAIRARVRQVANAEQVQRPNILEEELQLAEQRLARLERELETIGCNAARAGNVKLLRTIERQYEQKDAEVEAAREEVERLRGEVEEGGGNASLEGQIDAAMTLFDRIDRLTQEPEARSEIGEMLRDLDFRMWLRFHANPRGKRPKRVLQGGLITIGQGELPLLANHHGSDHPPDADDGGDDLASPSARNGLPTVVGKPRQREGTSFGKVTGGKPPVAPDSQFTS